MVSNTRVDRRVRTRAAGLVLAMGSCFAIAGPAVAAGTEASRPGAGRYGSRSGGPQGGGGGAESQSGKPESSRPKAGIFPFVPPYFTQLPGAALTVDTKGITYATDDRSMQFRIGGRYQEDLSAASTSPRLRGSTPLVAADGIDSRRAWIETYLTLSNGISAAFQYDFANATQPIQDGVVSYHAPGTQVITTVGTSRNPSASIS